MANFAANLSMMFPDKEFLERFSAASSAGFQAVEYLFPYAYEAAELNQHLAANGLTQVLFNSPPGDWDKGERGLAGLPGREQQFDAAIEQALDYATALSCPRVHVMAGILPAGADRDACLAVLQENFRRVAPRAAQRGINLLIEPINNRDMPGYLVNTPSQGRELIHAIGADNVRLQLDLYHCQIMCGNLAWHAQEFLSLTDHIQIAGVPGRHEPDVGEINYPFLFKLLDEIGYAGWIGCEYHPAADTAAGLGWLKRARGQ